MKVGLLGPADGDSVLVRQATEFLLDQALAEHVVYLGLDDAAVRCAESWHRELLGFDPTPDAFLTRACQLASQGRADQLQELLTRREKAQRALSLHGLPEPPARAVELFESKVVLLVHDKAQLDAEDIANAFLVVYGRSKAVALNHFGPRTFFSPGPLKSGHAALIERQPDGQLSLLRYHFASGELVARSTLESGRAKMVVQS